MKRSKSEAVKARMNKIPLGFYSERFARKMSDFMLGKNDLAGLESEKIHPVIERFSSHAADRYPVKTIDR
jgi:hypothetical protein